MPSAMTCVCHGLLPRDRAPGVDQGALGGIQHKVFEEFLVRIRGFEARIVPFHIYLTMLGPISHTRRNRILLSQRQRCVSGVVRDSNAKVPVSKVKTEILALRGRINGVLSHVQFHWAYLGDQTKWYCVS